MATTYTLISSVTVGSGGAASIDFTSIPATYTDLALKASINTSAGDPRLTFNSSSSGYSERLLYGNGTSAASASGTGSYFNWALQGINIANMFTSNDVYIPNYASSNNKSVSSDNVQEANQTTVAAYLFAGLWSNSAAITSITVTQSSGVLNQYSTFYLYGISNA